jgi:hypothetical protein
MFSVTFIQNFFTPKHSKQTTLEICIEMHVGLYQVSIITV